MPKRLQASIQGGGEGSARLTILFSADREDLNEPGQAHVERLLSELVVFASQKLGYPLEVRQPTEWRATSE